MTRRQCACLLAHSFFGSLKRPPGVEPNDFRFTVRDLVVGTAASPNSAVTFLNYFASLARNGIPEGPDEIVSFERLGFRKGPLPWQWDGNEKRLCKVEIVDGNIDDCAADVHAEFANAFVGGGVMTGDAAMEETLFLVKPELMVAMYAIRTPLHAPLCRHCRCCRRMPPNAAECRRMPPNAVAAPYRIQSNTVAAFRPSVT